MTSEEESRFIKAINEKKVTEKLKTIKDVKTKEVKEESLITLKDFNDIYNNLEKSTGLYRKDIIEFVESEKVKIGADSILGKALSGDHDSFDALVSKADYSSILFDSKMYKYSLYIAEKYNYAFAYINVYLALSHTSVTLSDKNDKNKWPLDYIEKKDRDLALYCLIKSYKMGEYGPAKVLSYYFKEGYYFPKSIDIANKFDSIYKKRAYHPEL